MDRFAIEVDVDGVLTVDTRKITLGPLPIALGQPGILPPRVENGCIVTAAAPLPRPLARPLRRRDGGAARGADRSAGATGWTWCAARSTPGSIPPIPSRTPAVAALVGGGLWTVVAAGVLFQPAPPDWPGYLLEVVPTATLAVAFLFVAVARVRPSIG